MKLLEIGQVAGLVGVCELTITDAKTRLGLQTRHKLRTNRQGRPARLYSLTEVLAYVVSRGLFAKGVDRECCDAVFRYLFTLAPEYVEASFARGARFILAVGNKALPRLIDREAIVSPSGIPPELAASLKPYAVDCQQLLAQIEARAAKLSE